MCARMGRREVPIYEYVDFGATPSGQEGGVRESLIGGDELVSLAREIITN